MKSLNLIVYKKHAKFIDFETFKDFYQDVIKKINKNSHIYNFSLVFNA
jgi:hypothetical protein